MNSQYHLLGMVKKRFPSILSRSLGKFTANKLPSSPTTTVILGWACATDRQMAPFEALHGKLGHQTLTYTMDVRLACSYDYNGQRRVAERLIEDIKGTGTRDVFVHSFCGNGYTMYQHLSELLASDSDLELCGSIIDSAPMPHNIRGYISPARGMTSHNFIVPLFIYTVMHGKEIDRSVLGTLKAGMSLLPSLRSNMAQYTPETLCSPGTHYFKESLQHPLLMLYSSADAYFPASFIRLCAQKQKERGRVVIEQDFVTSGHVAHYKSFPETYTQCVHDFVQSFRPMQ